MSDTTETPRDPEGVTPTPEDRVQWSQEPPRGDDVVQVPYMPFATFGNPACDPPGTVRGFAYGPTMYADNVMSTRIVCEECFFRNHEIPVLEGKVAALRKQLRGVNRRRRFESALAQGRTEKIAALYKSIHAYRTQIEALKTMLGSPRPDSEWQLLRDKMREIVIALDPAFDNVWILSAMSRPTDKTMAETVVRLVRECREERDRLRAAQPPTPPKEAN